MSFFHPAISVLYALVMAFGAGIGISDRLYSIFHIRCPAIVPMSDMVKTYKA